MGAIKCEKCIYQLERTKAIITTASGEKATVFCNNCGATEELQLTMFGEPEKVYNICSIVNRDGKCRFFKGK